MHTTWLGKRPWKKIRQCLIDTAGLDVLHAKKPPASSSGCFSLPATPWPLSPYNSINPDRTNEGLTASGAGESAGP